MRPSQDCWVDGNLYASAITTQMRVLCTASELTHLLLVSSASAVSDQVYTTLLYAYLRVDDVTTAAENLSTLMGHSTSMPSCTLRVGCEELSRTLRDAMRYIADAYAVLNVAEYAPSQIISRIEGSFELFFSMTGSKQRELNLARSSVKLYMELRGHIDRANGSIQTLVAAIHGLSQTLAGCPCDTE